jgi:hypothetical protein
MFLFHSVTLNPKIQEEIKDQTIQITVEHKNDPRDSLMPQKMDAC